MIDLTFYNFTRQRRSKIFFSKTLVLAAKLAGFRTKRIGLSLNVVGKNKIRALNKKYRSQDRPADVLSFPIDKPGEASRFLAAGAILELGDIFICPQVAGREKRKLAWLTVHGFLHLLGYDHEKSAVQRRKMFDLQKKILANLGLQ